MSKIVERETGATLLPPAGAERAEYTSWVAHCAADADLRAKVPLWADIAADLLVERE